MRAQLLMTKLPAKIQVTLPFMRLKGPADGHNPMVLFYNILLPIFHVSLTQLTRHHIQVISREICSVQSFLITNE